MKTQFYFLAPVEVVKVTNENLHEVAEWCGGKVASTESRRVPGRMDSYVWVPTPKGNALSWAFPGMYITKRLVVTVKDEMKATYAIFRKDYFSRNYFDTPSHAVDATWEKELRKKEKKQAPKPVSERANETAEALRVEGETVEKPAELQKYRHRHNSTDICVEGCEDPDTEGVHIFDDKRLTIENKENNMERSNHGYPVLSEEEAAARKAERELSTADATDEGVTMAEAIETVKEIIPGSEIVSEEPFRETVDENAPEAESDLVTPKDFAGALTDTQDEYREALDKLADQ